jgi:hypothetical protein
MRASRREALTLAAAVLALTVWGGGRAKADLMLTQTAKDEGFQLSTFATGFPSFGNVGPAGIGFTSGGGVLVSDYPGNVRLFPTASDGQVASAAPVGQNYNVANAAGIAQIGNNFYMAQQHAAGGGVVQISANGSFIRNVANGIAEATGIIANPSNGHLFVSTSLGGSSVFDVNPVTGAARVFANVQVDGMAITADGKTLYGAVVAGNMANHIVSFDTATGKLTDLGYVPYDVDGAALGGGTFAGNIFVNTNDGFVVEINLATGLQTLIASGGSRGDFVMPAPDGSLLLTQSDSILRLTPPPGGSFNGPGTGGPNDEPHTPEPSTLALFGLGAAALAGWRWRRRWRDGG